MELAFFCLAVLATGSLLYFVLVAAYLGFTDRPPLLALNLSWKLTLVTIFGVVLGGVGGLIGAAFILVSTLKKFPNYSRIRDIAAAVVMAILSSIALYFAILYLAFGILD